MPLPPSASFYFADLHLALHTPFCEHCYLLFFICCYVFFWLAYTVRTCCALSAYHRPARMLRCWPVPLFMPHLPCCGRAFRHHAFAFTVISHCWRSRVPSACSTTDCISHAPLSGCAPRCMHRLRLTTTCLQPLYVRLPRPAGGGGFFHASTLCTCPFGNLYTPPVYTTVYAYFTQRSSFEQAAPYCTNSALRIPVSFHCLACRHCTGLPVVTPLCAGYYYHLRFHFTLYNTITELGVMHAATVIPAPSAPLPYHAVPLFLPAVPSGWAVWTWAFMATPPPTTPLWLPAFAGQA